MNTVSPAPVLNSYELSKANNYLLSTRDDLLKAVERLPDSHWKFKPSPDCWSIVEIVEHLVLIEDRIHAIIGRMPDAPLAEPDRVNSQIEDIIYSEVPKRGIKLQAPPPVCPSCQWSPMETLARFFETRIRTRDLLNQAPCLRGHLIPHPILGAWDGYQWIIATAAHSARHTAQILEVKASTDFPQIT